jgi:hypothetical protein
MLSLSIGTPILLLFGGGLFWLYSRRNQQDIAGKNSSLTTNSPWMSSSAIATSSALPQASDTIPFTAPSPYAPVSSLSSNEQMGLGANMFQQSISPSPAMSPLPLDAFDPPYDSTKSIEPEHTQDKPVIEINPSIATPMSVAAETPSMQLPDIADDPMLENVMRQAQLGLFVIPKPETR